MASAWWQQREKGGRALLRLSIFLVRNLPQNLLKPIIFCVSYVYYLICKNERENIKFYLSLLNKRGIKTSGAFLNFYYFAISICDKFRIWLGKMDKNKVKIIDHDMIKSEFSSSNRGRVLLVSHMGNIDIARAISNQTQWLDITILVYKKHSAEFFKMRNEAGDLPVKVFEVDELDINAMMRLSEIIDGGGHIGIMGDRVPLSGVKSVKVPFLGHECEFPVGAFLIAGMLKTKISCFWAMQKDDCYEISLTHIADEVELGQDRIKSVRKYLEIYVKELEKKCEAYPHQFFNFYNFWQVGGDRI